MKPREVKRPAHGTQQWHVWMKTHMASHSSTVVKECFARFPSLPHCLLQYLPQGQSSVDKQHSEKSWP